MDQILITAFEPFGGAARNASAEVLRLLPDEIGGTAVRKLLLPVVFGKAAETVLSLKADAVFMLGEAGGRMTVTPEKKAKNLRDARIPDNAGNQPKGEKIRPDGPAEMITRIPVEHIAAQMQKENYAVTLSDDAGAFVCNDTFYLVGTGCPLPVEFIHCPADPDRAESFAGTVLRFIELALHAVNTLRAAADYIRDLFKDNADGHGPDHSLRVYRTALRIAESEPAADRFLVALGALLHDADDSKLFKTENNANARAFLEAQGTEPETADRICAIVNSVSFSKNKGKHPETIEAKIVQDADRLDAIGAVGVARTFAYGGKHNRPPEDSILHFHEKLLRLRDLMNTAEAGKIAASRHAFMELFLKEWEREIKE